MKFRKGLIASCKIWLVIYPSITLFYQLFGDTLAAFPLYVRTLVTTLIWVPWVVFFGVPFIDWMFRIIFPANDKE